MYVITSNESGIDENGEMNHTKTYIIINGNKVSNTTDFNKATKWDNKPSYYFRRYNLYNYMCKIDEIKGE